MPYRKEDVTTEYMSNTKYFVQSVSIKIIISTQWRKSRS